MKHSTFRQSILAGVVALTLGATGTALADGNTNGRFSYDTSASNPMSSNSSNWSNSPNSSNSWNPWYSSTDTDGKQRATTIGIGSGAVVGALVGGPIGAVIGAGVGGYVGNRGTDANGSVAFNSNSYTPTVAAVGYDADVQRAQRALTAQGYVLASDGIAGPNTATALRDFQDRNGLAMTGTLDEATMVRLGI